MRNAVLLSLSPLALVAGCNQITVNNPKVDEKAVLAEIRKVEAAQLAAIEADDLAGATAPYAAEASFVLPGSAPLSGEAISKSFAAMIADPAMKLLPDEEGGTAWVSASGDLAVTGFTADFTSTGADGKVSTVPLANQSVWKKQEDGSWKMLSDFNMVWSAAD